MKKRILIFYTLLVFGVGSLAGTKPHIVYILADDMGHGDVQALRAECKFPTPHLNRLCNEGVAFTQAYTGSSICTPTRYGIMTGRYCWRDGIGLASGYSKPEISSELPTVAEFLREQGYRTRMVGKWHLGGQWTGVDGKPVTAKKPNSSTIDFAKGITGGPVDQGFESWFGIIASLDMPPYVYFRDRMPTVIPTKPIPAKGAFGNRAGLADPDLSPYAVLGDITSESVKVIESHDPKEPLFLYMPLSAPHTPVVPRIEWQGLSKLDEHADFRMEVDHCVGRVLKALEEKGMQDDSIVIFAADNGSASFAVKSMREKGHDSSDGRRGWKATYFEGGHRVPFIVRWPNGVKDPGRFDSKMITLEDFFATVSDILGAALPAEAGDSVSFLPQLNEAPQQDPFQRNLIMSSLGNKLVLRHGEWKLICVGEKTLVAEKNKKGKKRAVDGAWHEQVTLYNLAQDVAEKNNVAQQNPTVVAELAKWAITAIKEGRTNNGPVRPNSCKEAQIDLLQKLVALN